MTPPPWLHALAWISVVAALLSALWIAIDILGGHRQKMWIMDLVWPVTGLWAGPLGLWAYYRMGRASRDREKKKEKPFWQSVAVGATHCGAGCSLGDLVAEVSLAALQLSVKDGLVAALKADSLSLTAWQLGMYGWMAVALFALFSPERLPKSSPDFWFMMQIAMLAGFATSYPVNWWLLRKGIKEAM